MTDQHNILQIDVEDWYCDLDFRLWDACESRVVETSTKLLHILKEHHAQATFFILGYVAERFPRLVEKVKEEGHEVASHGYAHRRITEQSEAEFEEDLIKSIEILEKITGDRIWGYRAPQFTVVEKTSWVIDILQKHGLKYDSSIFPVKTPLYGVPDAPRHIYHIRSADIKKDHPNENFLEFPPSVYRIPLFKKNVPIAGGFYLRFFPYPLLSHAIKKINRSNHAAVCYLHPWELDPDKPRIKDLKWYHYYRLRSTEKKFKKLVGEFEFISTRHWIESKRS